MKYWTFTIALLWSIQVFAQTNIYESPHAVIYNHLFYLQPDSYDPVQSAKSIPQGYDDPEQLAIQLKQILDAQGMYIDLNRVPTAENYIDSAAHESIYILDKKEPLIYVEKIDSQWRYSRTTAIRVPELHKELFPFGSGFSAFFKAPFWSISVFGLDLWQWLGLLFLLIAFAVFAFVSNRITRPIFSRFIKKRMELTSITNTSMLRLSRIIGLLIGTRALTYAIPMLEFSPKLNALLIRSIYILTLFLVLFAIRNIVKIVFNYLDRLADRTENTLDNQLLPVLERLLMMIVWAFGIIYILDALDVNVTALLAGVSIGGLALALAAQDTVKNFFGSIMIFLDKPFQIGDTISFRNVEGTVEEVGVRSTRIRTFENSITYVPNAILADSIIDNIGLRVYRRFKTNVGVTYDTTPQKIDAFISGIKKIIQQHPHTRKDAMEVHLNSLGDSSINILLYMFFDTKTWSDELKSKHDILAGILILADQLNISFAFPTQTLQLERAEPKEPEANSLDEALDEVSKYYKHKSL